MSSEMRTTLRVAEGGRIVIPVEVRQRLGMEIGSDLVLTVEDDHVMLTNAKAARRKARQRVEKYVPRGISLSRELMAQRKKDARHE